MSRAKKGKENTLTDKQNQFCYEYLIDLNASKAADRAGYSKKTTRAQGARLLKNPLIQNRLSELARKFTADRDLTPESVLHYLSAVMKSTTENYLAFGQGGIILKESSEISPEQLALIESVSDTKEGVSFKLPRKLDAAEKLMKYFGMFAKDNNQKQTKIERATIIFSNERTGK